MFEFTDNRPEIAVQETEYKRLLGFPVSYELTGRSRELADWAARWYERNGKPWLYIRQAEALIISNGTVIIDGEVISSPRLHGQLMEAHADETMLVAVSAGKELEEEARRLWMGEKPEVRLAPLQPGISGLGCFGPEKTSANNPTGRQADIAGRA